MWNDIEVPWKEAITLAWECYKRKSIPVACVITDKNGTIMSKGRNKVYDKSSLSIIAGTNMVYGEVTALLKLKIHEHSDIHSYTLYTTLEPCPMCFGAIVMMNIGHLKYGASDIPAGAVELAQSMEFIKKRIYLSKKALKKLKFFRLFCS